jgi:hypothetical protein
VGEWKERSRGPRGTIRGGGGGGGRDLRGTGGLGKEVREY